MMSASSSAPLSQNVDSITLPLQPTLKNTMGLYLFTEKVELIPL